MDQNEIENIAKRFHETYERLAPPEVVPVPWGELSPEVSRLLIMVMSVVMQDVTTAPVDAQQLEFDRNHWQRKVGVLLSLVGQSGDDALIESAYKTVNTNWYTKSQGDPIADIARRTVDQTIETAIAAGIVVPVKPANGAG